MYVLTNKLTQILKVGSCWEKRLLMFLFIQSFECNIFCFKLITLIDYTYVPISDKLLVLFKIMDT